MQKLEVMKLFSNEVLRMELDSLQNEIREAERELNETLVPSGVDGRGIIVFKYIRCGKPNCRCMQGGQPHGPYPHLQWWEGKKLRTRYLNRKIYSEFAKEHSESKKAMALQKKLVGLRKREERLIRLLSN